MLDEVLKKHISLLCTQEIHEIGEPYFKKFHSNYLTYIRVYNDSQVSYLCSNHAWLKHYYLQNYPAIGAFEQNIDFTNYRYVLWNTLADDKILEDSRNIFNIYHGIAIIQKHANYCEYFNIGTSIENGAMLNFFINNLDQLSKFFDYFKAKASRLIRIAHSQRLNLPELCKNHENNKTTCTTNNLCSLDCSQNCAELLTKTENICIKFYLAGKQPKEIAELLGISNRTVEKHIENVKTKFNCKKQLQLGYALAKAGIEI